MKNNLISGMVFGALIMLVGVTIGFYAGYQKHEADSMRFINEWIEKQIKEQEQQKQRKEMLPLPPQPKPIT